MKVRRTFAALLLCLTVAPAFAADALVHIASFACPHCRDFEGYAPAVQRSAEKHGITYIFAPISLREETTYAAELAYYGSRSFSMPLAQRVRALLFDGTDQGLIFENASQVLEWLRLKEPQESVAWASLGESMESDTTRSALYRAYRLLQSAGVNSVPALVWVRDGSVVGSVQLEDGEPIAKFNERAASLILTIKE